jgi:predicted DNA-binding ribbon-helix-helix protein
MEDNRVDVPIELTDDDWYTLMKMAHERDITLNQLVEQILTAEMDRIEKELT